MSNQEKDSEQSRILNRFLEAKKNRELHRSRRFHICQRLGQLADAFAQRMPEFPAEALVDVPLGDLAAAHRGILEAENEYREALSAVRNLGLPVAE